MCSNWKNMALIRHSCVLGDYFCNTSHQPFKRLHSVWERNRCREEKLLYSHILPTVNSAKLYFSQAHLMFFFFFETLEEVTDEARQGSPRTLMFADDTVMCRGAGAGKI